MRPHTVAALLALGLLVSVGCGPHCAGTANSRALADQFLDAAEMGDVAAVKACLACGVKIEARREQSSATALMMATQNGNAETVKLLLNRGADPNLTENGLTPLMSASIWGYQRVVSLLLDRGAKIDAKDPGGKTAVYFAGISHSDDIVRLLISRGADPSQKEEVSPLASEFLRGEVAGVDKKNMTVRVKLSNEIQFAEKGAEVPLSATDAHYLGVRGIADLRKGDAVTVHFGLHLTLGGVNGATYSGSATTSYSIEELAVRR